MEEVSRLDDVEPGIVQHGEEHAAGVAGVVMADFVVGRPQAVESGDGEDEQAVVGHQMADALKGSWSIGEMFEDIEHGDEMEPLVGTEGFVEASDVNSRSPAAVVVDGVGIGFDSEDIAKTRQVVEHEAVAATDVQDGASGSASGVFVEHAIDDGETGAPPPVVLVEMPKLGDEIGVHGGKISF